MDPDERYDDDGYDAFRAERIREAVVDLAPRMGSRSVDLLTERFEEGVHFEVEPERDEDGSVDGVTFVATRAGRELVRREILRRALRDARRRAPVPMFVRVRPDTACRPQRAARRVRRRSSVRSRNGPSDPDLDLPHGRVRAVAA
jgi:hypothetical protein